VRSNGPRSSSSMTSSLTLGFILSFLFRVAIIAQRLSRKLGMTCCFSNGRAWLFPQFPPHLVVVHWAPFFCCYFYVIIGIVRRFCSSTFPSWWCIKSWQPRAKMGRQRIHLGPVAAGWLGGALKVGRVMCPREPSPDVFRSTWLEIVPFCRIISPRRGTNLEVYTSRQPNKNTEIRESGGEVGAILDTVEAAIFHPQGNHRPLLEHPGHMMVSFIQKLNRTRYAVLWMFIKFR
jgi:hypothetical protein